jgi:hypothetical protein
MSLYPAGSFSQFDPSTQPRQMMQSGWGSPLYIVHKDITQTMESPNNINEIITGSETEAQYSVVVQVPPGARYFVPFHVVNLAISSSPPENARFTYLGLTLTHASLTVARAAFYGRFPRVRSGYTYGPTDAGMTSAVSDATYGYWQCLGAYRMTASSGGTLNYCMIDMSLVSAGASIAPGTMFLGTNSADNTTQTIVGSMLHNVGGNNYLETPTGRALYPQDTASAALAVGVLDASGALPIYGCDAVTALVSGGSASPTITRSIQTAVGTIAISSWGIGVRFFA